MSNREVRLLSDIQPCLVTDGDTWKAAVTAAPHCGARDIMLCNSCESFATFSEGNLERNGSKRRPECHTGACSKKAAAWERHWTKILSPIWTVCKIQCCALCEFCIRKLLCWILHARSYILVFLDGSFHKPGSSESRLKYVQLSQLYWSKETWCMVSEWTFSSEAGGIWVTLVTMWGNSNMQACMPWDCCLVTFYHTAARLE